AARRTIGSLQAQAYSSWRLLVVPREPGSQPALVREWLVEGFADIGDRVAVVPVPRLAAIAAEANAAADGGWFATVLTPGDELGCDAFLDMALATASHVDWDFIYSGERRHNPATGRVGAFFNRQ